jgi:hypothetical protein
MKGQNCSVAIITSLKNFIGLRSLPMALLQYSVKPKEQVHIEKLELFPGGYENLRDACVASASHTRSGRPVSFACTVMPMTGRWHVCRFRHTFQLQLYRRPEQIRKLVRPTSRPEDCAGVPERV